MDEVLFRSAQKVENLQLRAELAATEAKDFLVVYIQQGKVYLLSLWNNVALDQVRKNIKDGTVKVITFAKDLQTQVMHYANPKELYLALLNIFGKKWTKRDLYFGCSGILIGCMIGVALGLSIRKREPIVRYMQAIQCNNYLGVESITVVEDAVAPHECGEYDVLVNVKAASVQIIDAQICSGYGRTFRGILGKIRKQATSDLPVTLGRDCTGVIVDIGCKVKRLEVGDEVWLTVPFWCQGTLCQTVLVCENRVARKPKNIGFEGACSLPYAGSLALSVLNETTIDSSNAHKKTILVQGGCTPVGCILIQLLKHWKAKVTATCHKRAVPVVKALGATDIIVLAESSALNDTSRLDLENETTVQNALCKELEIKGSIFDVIINTSIDYNFDREDFVKFLNSNGCIKSTLPPKLVSDSCGMFSRYLLYWYIWIKYKLQNVIGLPINDYDETHLCYATLSKLTDFVEEGYLQTVVDKVFQPQDIELAMHHIQSSQSIGSTVITFR